MQTCLLSTNTMKAASEETPCTVCTKAVPATMCYGCQRSFCTRHFLKHRLRLAEQMDELQEKYEVFKQDFSRDKFEQPLLSSIYAWERKSMRRIQEIADKARSDLQQCMEITKSNVQSSLDQMQAEFAAHAKLNNFIETDLQRWTKQLEELRSSLETPSTISIVRERKSSSTIRGIKLIEQSTELFDPNVSAASESTEPIEEHFVSIFGPCKLSEGDRVVTHCNYRAGLSQISGRNDYSSGKHSVEFFIENKGSKNIFLGIHSSSKQTSSTFDHSVHGWWNLDYIIINGESEGGDDTETIQTDDKITLTLDCDHRQIQLEHHRTERLVQISIKPEVCAFPWKILVRLLSAGDCVRIL